MSYALAAVQEPFVPKWAYASYGATAPTTEPGHESSSKNTWLVPVVVVGVIGLIGMMVYFQAKTVSTIAEKEGSSGVLKYGAGTAAIGVASRWLSPRDRNAKRRKRAKVKRNR